MAKYRKRFNDKARAGMVARQDALKRARNKHLYQDQNNEDGSEEKQQPEQQPITSDPNAEVLVPMTKAEKAERKAKMSQELSRDAPGISSKKRKRLDKYIDRQLRKQENAELIEKISKNKVDTSQLQSLKQLGVGTRQTKRQRIEEAMDLERRGLGNEETRELLYEEHEVRDWKDSEEFKNYNESHEHESDHELEQTDHSNQTHEKLNQEPAISDTKSSSFIDYRPAKPAMGFGFKNLPTMKKSDKPKYNWRQTLAEQSARKYSKSKDKEMYFDSESEYDSESVSEGGSDVEGSEDEWTGFSDTELPSEDEDDDEEEHSGDNDEEEDDDEDENEKEELHSEDSADDSGDDQSRKRSGADFKKWIQQQNPEEKTPEMPVYTSKQIPKRERPEDFDAPTAEEMIPENLPNRVAQYVQVNRPDDIQEARLQLPVVGEEHRIMEAIHYNDCIVICGETGSGKTTQVPQFLYESGFGTSTETPGMIGVTQPRRVAAVSMANRVSTELADHGHRVGYQIRFDATVKKDTAVKFMTDGVLLRELATDFALTKYSVIIIDEAHERNINTDLLIGVLSRVMRLRKEMANAKPLKLVVMSATLRVADFTENTRLFDSPPPVLEVKARQFPVSIHFNRRTKFNYLDQVYDKAVKIHQRLPRGGILIFLTGQNEIADMVKRLRKAFPLGQQEGSSSQMRVLAKEATTEVEDVEFGLDDLGSDDEFDDEIGDDYENQQEEEKEEGFDEELEEDQDADAPMHVLPLYSLLPTREQMKVFDTPPDGSRLVVVATNVAETSLTIPGIRYVVDCGRSKERHYDEETGVQSFKVGWTSKASANQRAGRAGRTGPGHCYRIYSSAVYENDFAQFTRPEIERMPIEGVVLQMKYMGIHNIVNFPFPSPPPDSALQKGLKLLKYLGALYTEDESITELGRNMSLFPLSPRFAKMLLLGNQHECLAYIVAIVAGLTVGDPFLSQHELGIDKSESTSNSSHDDTETIEIKEARRKMRGNYFRAQSKFAALDDTSDALKLLCAVCAFDYDKTEQFARDHFLRFKVMDEIHKLRKQIAYIVASNTRENAIEKTTAKLNAQLRPPTKLQIKALKQMISAGFIDQVAIRADMIYELEQKPSRTINYPYASLFPSVAASSAAAAAAADEDSQEADPYAYIHPNSLLAESGERPPEYLVFGSMNLSASGKVRMKPLCDITGAQLSNVAKNSALITYSKPLGPPYGPRAISATKRECWVVPRMGAAIGTGGVGWDLPVVKVIQVKRGTSWVVQ